MAATASFLSEASLLPDCVSTGMHRETTTRSINKKRAEKLISEILPFSLLEGLGLRLSRGAAQERSLGRKPGATFFGRSAAAVGNERPTVVTLSLPAAPIV